MRPDIKIIPVILCGGAGERLWPISTKEKPKAFLPLIDQESLLQQTVRRSLSHDIRIEDVIVVTLSQWEEEARNHLKPFSNANIHYILEPMGKGTLPAVAMATLYAQNRWPDAYLWFLPCDHYFAKETDFAQLLTEALNHADDHMVVFTVKPTKAETAYGYVIADDFGKIEAFVEKPSYELAETLIGKPECFWNTGIYLSSVDHTVSMLLKDESNILLSIKDMDRQRPGHECYASLEKGSFETSVLQKSKNLIANPIEQHWTDIGRWRTVWEHSEKDSHGNVLQGQVLCENVQDSLVYGGEGRIISCIGLKNTVVIDAGDTLLVADIDSAEAIRELISQVQTLKQRGRTLQCNAIPSHLQDLLTDIEHKSEKAC